MKWKPSNIGLVWHMLFLDFDDDAIDRWIEFLSSIVAHIVRPEASLPRCFRYKCKEKSRTSDKKSITDKLYASSVTFSFSEYYFFVSIIFLCKKRFGLSKITANLWYVIRNKSRIPSRNRCHILRTRIPDICFLFHSPHLSTFSIDLGKQRCVGESVWWIWSTQ